MDLNLQKEKFSEAYVRAVAAVAGFGVSRPEVDDDSVDLTIAARGGKGTVRSPRLDIQLKCTANAAIDEGKTFSFPLKIKNYDDLRDEQVMVPRVLVVVRVPDDVAEWSEVAEDQLLLRHCGYWVSLRGASAVNNTTNKTVDIPRSQIFTVDHLKSIMNRIGTGGMP
ncbi:MAG: DUF4365 domain-containing protein [Magnetococcales bacterium]|nr:DUF4365 domain-containing protein [Magnetococcales bacterium]NGZ06912.1 DUF4365 domain-containing protein [Magnetococcales bacterium]